MVFILSDEILERLTCCACKKYLSVKPVKVYANKQIKCGRCSQNDDGGMVSLYGHVAEDGLFKCINRFDGCNMLLPYSEVQAHEQVCKSNAYKCSICVMPNVFATFLLPDHFKTQHQNECLGKPEFIIDLLCFESERRYFYKQYDSLFLIYANVSKKDDIIGVNVSFFGENLTARKIQHRFSIFTAADTRLLCISEKRACSAFGFCGTNTKEFCYSEMASFKQVICKFEVNTSTVASLTVFPNSINKAKQQNIQLTYTADELEEKLFPQPYFDEDIKAKFPDISISDCGMLLKKTVGPLSLSLCSFFCSICHCIISSTQVVFKLTSHEYLCTFCRNVYSERNEYHSEMLLACNILDRITFACRWGCGLIHSIKHKCKNHSPRICPLINCDEVGTFDELVLHFVEKHAINFQANDVVNSDDFSESRKQIHFILNRFVLLDVDVNYFKTFRVTVIDKQYNATKYDPATVDFSNLPYKINKYPYQIFTECENVKFHIILR